MTVPLPAPRIGPPPLPGPGCDCTRCAFWSGPDGTGGPATVEPLCSGPNASCSYCGCARTEGAASAEACGRCPIRCGSRIDIAGWMTDVGGTLAFDDLTVPGEFPPGLPRLIPQLDGSAPGELDQQLHWGAYAVGLRRVFSPATHTVLPRFRDRDVHEVLELRPGQAAVLAGYGEDPLVEAFWTRRRIEQLVEQIAAQGWDLVLAPNYSIFGNWPRIEHLLNMRRCLIIAAELATAGVPTLVNMYWFRLEDLKRWVDWVADTDPAGVAVNVQTARHGTHYEEFIEPGLHWLAANLPPGPRVVLSGLSRTDRIRAAVDLFGDRLHIVSQNPHQFALHGAVMTGHGRRDVHARPADAFTATVRYMASLLPPPSAGER